MPDLFFNFPLIAALLGVFSAQFLKIPIHYYQTKKIRWDLFISTGGMPSSHSASVTSLATAVGALHGLGSSLFAVAAMFAIIVMYDAKGIRWHAGEQAAVLNDLVEEFRDHVKKTNKEFEQKNVEEQRKELKELLGHSPKEVLFGGLLGITQTLILSWLFLG
jgi:uncharacterized protein